MIVADTQTDHLKNFFYDPKLIAKPGMPGQGNQRTGKSAPDAIFKVPPGTIIYTSPDQAESRSEDDQKGEKLIDMTEEGQRFVLCKGGKGGKGNIHFKSSTNRAPRECTPGGEAEEGYFYFELRRIADAGLVGFPNAGKSTLLSKISAAHPKVAAYPFTTLQPMIGVVDFKGFMRGTVADIPGLIEGAHDNVGLGHDFLRHIMRCQVLLFVLDMAAVDGRDPISDLEILRKEVKLHDESLAKRDWLIVANKMDLPESQEKLTHLQNRFPDKQIIPISADKGEGIDELRAALKPLIGHRPD